MKLWTQYQILVQFCFQGMSSWHSVALILAAVQTWTVLWDVLSSLTKKPSCSPSANLLPWNSQRHGLLFSSQRPCHGSCCPLWLLHVTAAASLLECPGKDQGDKKRQRVCGAGWCPSQGCWVVLQEDVGRGHCWRAADLLCTHPLSRSGRDSAVQREERAWTAVLNCTQEKGKRNGKWMLQCLLSSYFRNLSGWVWLEVFVNA